MGETEYEVRTKEGRRGVRGWTTVALTYLSFSFSPFLFLLQECFVTNPLGSQNILVRRGCSSRAVLFIEGNWISNGSSGTRSCIHSPTLREHVADLVLRQDDFSSRWQLTDGLFRMVNSSCDHNSHKFSSMDHSRHVIRAEVVLPSVRSASSFFTRLN